MNDILIHEGVGHEDDPPGRGSGRYAWGSGENPGQHQYSFVTEVNRLKKNGLTEAQIAVALLGYKPGKYDKNGDPIPYTSSDLRAELSIQKSKERQFNHARALELLEECNGNVSEVARRMGRNESTIRSFLKDDIAERTDRYQNTAEVLRNRVDEYGVIDVSSGTELFMNVPEYTKKVGIAILEKEGYVKTWVKIPQQTTNHETSVMVLAKPDMTYSEIAKLVKEGKMGTITDFTPDEGKTFWTPEFPESLDSKRVFIRYGDQGGEAKDGVIELRRGVKDISLDGSQYAQVRIAVDGTHYMKGMAMYADDIPDGYDVVYNTNKKTGTPALGDSDHTVLKLMKKNEQTGEIDKDNPFGALIKSPTDKDGIVTAGGQRHYIGDDGKEHLSPINKLRDEGDWDSWSRNLASQFLSKQPQKLIDQQLKLSTADKREELDEILRLNNPVIKKKMLDDFANGCDANAADLSAKGFKNQAFQVLLPITDMKDTEIYAPRYNNGDIVALIRYPHGGTFEIPKLKVNNKQKTAEKVMFDAKDAVGISQKVAERLSGADFDGDTALVIPIKSNNINVQSTNPLKGLEGFNPKIYKMDDSAPRISNSTKQNEMGKVTNLIADMTVGGANPNEIAKAVRHSMVVIDSEKHHLDYKQSYKDNDIKDLKKLYQGVSADGKTVKGASTILTKAKSEAYINERKEVTDTKKMTAEELERWNQGKKVYRDTGKLKKTQIKDPNKMTSEELEVYNSGKKVYRTTNKYVQEKVHKMDLVDDAMDLVRDPTNKKELAYANYANSLKSMADEARRESRNIKSIPVDTQAKKVYAKEVESLNAKLRIAQSNTPKERSAQNIANSIANERINANPDWDNEHRQRERARALTEARAIVGAKKQQINITDNEWAAIQANAISTNKLTQILNNTDQDAFKQRATPKGTSKTLTKAQQNLINVMHDSGMYTQREIADRLGVSISTVSNYIK